MIQAIDVYKNFGHQAVLKGTNLTIEEGGITTIIGGSGSGKTVLLKTMIALLLPDRGQILVDGTDITRLGQKPLNQIRKRFGFLFQGAALLDSMDHLRQRGLPAARKDAPRGGRHRPQGAGTARSGGPQGHGLQVPRRR